MHLSFSGIYNSHSHLHTPYQKVHPYISRPFFNTPLLPRRHRNIHPCLVTSYHLYPQRSSKKKKKKKSKKASTRQQPQPTSKQAVSSKRRQVPTRRKTNFSRCPLSEVLGTVVHGLEWRNPKKTMGQKSSAAPQLWHNRADAPLQYICIGTYICR